jgi:predicted transposase YbfD/YdcC
MLSDNGHFTDMGDFAADQLPWLRTFLVLKNGAPSHDVFRNVFMAIKPAAFLSVMNQWCGPLFGKHIAIDGKALRGTYDRSVHKCLVHVLRAWVCDVGLSVEHLVCAEKSNELEALPRLLAAIELKGTIVTIDAMGGHPGIANQIHAAGGDFLLALKGNEKSAFETVKEHFETLDNASVNGVQPVAQPSVHETIELSHGRYEHREYEVIGNIDWFDKS